MAEDTDSQDKVAESDGPSKAKPSRRDLFKIAGAAAGGILVGSKVSREKQPEGTETKENTLRKETTPTINGVFEVSSSLNSVLPENDPEKENLESVISQDEIVGKFLKGSAVISTLMIDKHLTGRLTTEEIEAVTNAIMKLQGVDYKSGSGEEGPQASIKHLDDALKLRT